MTEHFLILATSALCAVLGYLLGLLQRRSSGGRFAPAAERSGGAALPLRPTCSGCGAVLVDVEESVGLGWCPAGCGVSAVRP